MKEGSPSRKPGAVTGLTAKVKSTINVIPDRRCLEFCGEIYPTDCNLRTDYLLSDTLIFRSST